MLSISENLIKINENSKLLKDNLSVNKFDYEYKDKISKDEVKELVKLLSGNPNEVWTYIEFKSYVTFYQANCIIRIYYKD